jgi:uncharacterized protein with ACT and thioredoxin-like domain
MATVKPMAENHRLGCTSANRAAARRNLARAHRVALGLQGTAVREVRRQGLVVISLNMARSVPDAADLVATDPVQAGVMAVMAVSDTAKFTLERLKRRVFLPATCRPPATSTPVSCYSLRN